MVSEDPERGSTVWPERLTIILLVLGSIVGCAIGWATA